MKLGNHLGLSLSIFLALTLHVALLFNFERLFEVNSIDSIVQIDLVFESAPSSMGQEDKIVSQAEQSEMPEEKRSVSTVAAVEKIVKVKPGKPIKKNHRPKSLPVVKFDEAADAVAAQAKINLLSRMDKRKESVSQKKGGEETGATRSSVMKLIAEAVNNNKRYPQRARRRAWEGRAVWNFVIDSRGELSQLELFESSGRQLLDRAAQQAIKRSSPVSAVDGLLQDPMRIRLAVSFRLQ